VGDYLKGNWHDPDTGGYFDTTYDRAMQGLSLRRNYLDSVGQDGEGQSDDDAAPNLLAATRQQEMKAAPAVDQTQGKKVLKARTYTPLDLPGPETPFEIAHFKREFLDEVQRQEETDPVYTSQWQKLHENYSTWDAIKDYYRFTVDEAIEYYRKTFMEQ
jgi:hypothetical protein